MDEEQRKEIELLLENTEKNNDHKLKKYLRLVLPHVALVLVVCIYAMVGAFIFHAIESPHEDMLKRDGINKINNVRSDLIELIWQKSGGSGYENQEEWIRQMSRALENFNQNLYKVYKDQYVRYGDVRMSKAERDPREKRHRSSSKSRSEAGGKLWTSSSSLFFAATTMATIGYGNVVPVTMKGRLFCVAFALFGAPLAIITIGDLGKFLSECTIWLYKKMVDGKRWCKLTIIRMMNRNDKLDSELDTETGETGENGRIDWDDFDRTEVPVILVFVILLLYIAFGGVLFSYIESWSYMDAFYYCFVSLTTIGFGDLVPERHEYILLMLIYLGVGLAVTTMCIDLVGIKYIQKIHYFGRKFRGTDILQMLKRRRMIERKLAMGNTEDVMQMIHHVVQEQQKEVQQAKPPPPQLNINSANELWQHDDQEKASLRSDDEVSSWKADETLVNTELNQAGITGDELMAEESVIGMSSLEPMTDLATSADVEGHDEHYAKLMSRPETPLSNSSEAGRDWMYNNWDDNEDRAGSDVSGPAMSDHCSIHTSPSVCERERMFDQDHSPQGSVTSFKFSFDGPWPNLKEIATQARSARRLVSCPGDIERPNSPTLYNAVQGTEYFLSQSCSSLSSNVRRHHSEYSIPSLFPRLLLPASHPVLLYLSRRFPPYLLSHLAAVSELEQGQMLLEFRQHPHVRMFLEQLVQPDIVHAFPVASAFSVIPNEATRKSRVLEMFTAVRKRCSFVPTLSTIKMATQLTGGNIQMNASTSTSGTVPQPEPVLKRKKKARQARNKDPIVEMDWLNISPRYLIVNQHEDMSSIASPAAVTCIEDWISYVQLLDDVQQPLSRVRSPIYPYIDEIYPHTELPFVPFVWPPKTGSPDVQVLSPVSPQDVASPVLNSPIPTFVAATLQSQANVATHPERVDEKAQVKCYTAFKGPMPIKLPTPEPSEDTSSSLLHDTSSSSSYTTSPLFDIDLGGFELVDSGLSAEALLSTDDPVIYHRDMPVHSVHHDTVQTEAALENLMNAPESMLSNSVPPTMVADNYCFIVDGDKIRMGDIMGDDQWWRHTSRPTKYFYSEDLRKFYRVNCITARGKIISAKLATTTPMSGGASLGMPPNQAGPSTSSSLPTTAAASSATTPRSSMSVTSRSQRGEKVPLEHVYKVIRFYSFWNTCTSFHRIVTMIDRIVTADKNDNVKMDFKRRLFVQYLWRNAKPSDKARVQKEFDPRRQRLLRFVTSPAERKKMQQQYQQQQQQNAQQPWARGR
ncbi:unnamed protein product [Bursaphelenchus okinawaensis]|uniref:Potassium channel domain-containing protein n=1 Tax=Bursaphelenchus okinawaensis TaxID=465554 RepID=A0A811K2S9_9BILA|nr:unnamed protein product [Bursaphelenchus okinawaensis]CAG9090927.1 unnamed protein product [Bursaphelenchus okinawaensis]